MKTLIQFFSLAKPFWLNRSTQVAWLLLAVAVALALLIIQISVWITEWHKVFYDALAAFDGTQMPALIVRYLSYLAMIVACIVCGNWLRKVLVFRWRAHLTEQFQTQWLAQHKHYHLPYFQTIDNPDQRIAEDVALLAEYSIDLFKYFVMNVAKLIAFVAILWDLSQVYTFHWGAQSFTIHGYLVWVALVYSLVCTLLMHWIGHKLQPLNVERQHQEANYRATLLHIREHSVQIAAYQGEAQENHRLLSRFEQIKQNWQALIARELKIELFSASYLRLSLFIPIFATLPMYLAKTMSFGEMMQARSAFSNVQDGFGWFMDYYKKLMEWAAVVERLAAFQAALRSLDVPNKAAPSRCEPQAAHLCAENLSVFTPENRPLFANFSLNLTACDWVLIDGRSGVGKSTLLKTLAGLWPFHTGKVDSHGSRLFLPQAPYLTEDLLRNVLCYPNAATIDEAKLGEVLEQVGLADLASQLDEYRAWHKVLSGGEQQRISLARALLARPQILFLDEATNQLDSPTAVALMQAVKSALPNTLCLAISHQAEVKALFHTKLNLEYSKNECSKNQGG